MLEFNEFTDVAEYNLVLYTPYEKPINSLNRKIENLEYNGTLLGTDEVRFSVPFYIKQNNERIKNPVYDQVKGDFLVLIKNDYIRNKDGKFFVIRECSEETDKDGSIYKECILYTRENLLNDKHIIGYEADSRLIYDPMDELDENGLEKGFLNYIFNRTSWSVGDVSPSFLSKYRSINISNSTMLKSIRDMGETFSCVFSFDTINKKISVHELSEMGSNNDLFISDRNFITNLKKTINSGEIKTRLYLYGKDNISIQKINPLGQPYLDNFSYYMTTEYMTESLIDALDEYQVFFESKKPIFEESVMEIDRINKLIDQAEEELLELKIDLSKLLDNYDLSLINDENFPDIEVDLENKRKEVGDKENQIEELYNLIDEEENKIALLKEEIKKENHFSEEDLHLLDSFIKEEVYSNSDYREDQLQELYEFGEEKLSKISSPSIEFDIDVVDFLTLIKGQSEWHKFNVGDIVRIKNNTLGFNQLVRLVGYSHDVEDASLSLQFSNKDNPNDSSTYLQDVLDNINTSATSVNWNKHRWGEGAEANLKINDYISGNLDLAKQQIVAGDNQQPIVDDRGIWLRKQDRETGYVDPKQIRLVNNIIALTKDDWQTVDIAISPDMGINAELINGKIGNFATLNANQITVSNDFAETELGEVIDNKVGIPLGENKSLYELLIEKTDELQADVDSTRIIHRGSYIPTRTNEPTSTWITEGKEDSHIGDVFIDTNTGKMYEFKSSGTTNNWIEIVNQDILDAIDELQENISKGQSIHRGTVVPTGSNAPANTWTTSDMKTEHNGDVYIDTATGKMYQYTSSSNSWSEITNQEIIDQINQVKDEVNKVVLSKSEPTGIFLKGDLWIMPCGATFTYDTSFESAYRWQLTTPALDDLITKIVKEIRDKGISMGLATSTTTSASVGINVGSGTGLLSANFTAMTGTWNSQPVPELWMAVFKGYMNKFKVSTFYVYYSSSDSFTPSTTYMGYYNINSGTIHGLTRNPSTDALMWKEVKDSVTLGELYNNVKITQDKGIQVLDANNRERVQLGNWATNRYGLKLTDQTGQNTILDDNGILQTWQDGRCDNIDNNYPLRLRVFIPSETSKIYKSLLRIYVERYRAFSKGTASAGYDSKSTASGGSQKVGRTTSSGGGSTVSPTTGSGGGVVRDTLADKQVDGGMEKVYDRKSPNGAIDYNQWIELYVVKSHSHGFNIPNHSHSVSVSVPNHTHDFNFDIASHAHNFTIADHSHATTYGIHEDSSSGSNMQIYINGTNRTSALTGSSYFSSNQSELNITTYLNVGAWNTIEIRCASRARVDATVFVQALLNYGGY